MSLRVLVVNKFWYRRGGAEIVALAHERMLRERGHVVAHLSMHHPDNLRSPFERYFVSEVDFHRPTARALTRPFGSREVERKVAALVAAHRPDVALLHNVYHQLGASLVVALDRLDVPSMMVLHDQKAVCPTYAGVREGTLCSDCSGGRYWEAAVHGCGGSRSRGALFALDSLWQRHVSHLYERIELFAAPSEWLRARFSSMGFAHPIELLRNPVIAPDVLASPATHRTVGFVGRLEAGKGADLLCEAARETPELCFEIVGSGQQEEDLRRTAPANVSFLGWLDEGELAAVRTRWRAAVVCSMHPENAPLSATEALAAGLPVIGTRVGGIPEIVGDAGIVVEPRAQALVSALKEIAADDAWVERLSARARERAELYGEAAVATELEALLIEAIRRRRAGTAPRGWFGRGS